MSEDISNILDQLDLTNTDTSFPVLGKGNYLFKVADVQLVENKAATGHNLKVKYTLEQEGALDRLDNPVNAGFPITEFIGLTTSENRGQDQIERDLALFMESTLGEKGLFGDPEQYIGKEVVLVLDVQHDEQYGWQNRIKGKKHPSAS